MLGLWVVRRSPGAAWWWIASAFAISWVTDFLAHRYGPSPMSPLYLVSQTGLIAAVVMSRRDALWFLGLLVSIGAIVVGFAPPKQPDFLLHTVAWAGLAGYLWSQPALGRLRVALLVAFGCGWLAWMGYVLSPGWVSWIGYQSVRACGIGLFCWAALNPEPKLRLA